MTKIIVPDFASPSKRNPFPYVEAIYREEALTAFKGHPYICALPPIPDLPTLRKALNVLPPFKEEERDLPASRRIQLLGQLRKLFIAFPRVVRLAQAMLTMLHAGYEHRRPFSTDDNASLQALYKAQMTGKFVSAEQTDLAYQVSLALVAMSGCGKSFGLRHIVGLVPPVIYHPELGKWQLPFLYVEMAYDGKSAHTMATAIVNELDRLLPDAGYGEMFKGAGNAEQRLIKVLSAARSHGLGMLIIDEGQNKPAQTAARSAKNKERTDPMPLARLLITACNTAKVPLMFSGTPELMELMGPRFTKARRGSGDGSAFWENLTRSQPGETGEFESMLRILLKYQWVRNPVTFTEELADCMFEYTQGVPDMVVKLWRAAQTLAINSDVETIDGTIIANAFEAKFKLAERGLLSLKHRGRLAADTVSDLISPMANVADLCAGEFAVPTPLEPIGVKKVAGVAAQKSSTATAKSRPKSGKALRAAPGPTPVAICDEVIAAADIRGAVPGQGKLVVATPEDLLQ